MKIPCFLQEADGIVISCQVFSKNAKEFQFPVVSWPGAGLFRKFLSSFLKDAAGNTNSYQLFQETEGNENSGPLFFLEWCAFADSWDFFPNPAIL
jgi:hypothetical protein